MKLLHVAERYPNGGIMSYLFLRKVSPDRCVWFEQGESGQEQETSVSAINTEEALRLGARQWKDDDFRTLLCEFRFTLPERDEHGMNALFHQMAASYSSPTGNYFDEDLGHNCIVKNASIEALDLWQKLSIEKRL